MSEPLSIFDLYDGRNVFLKLRDILAVLPGRTTTTEWSVAEHAEWPNETYFEMASDGDDPISQAYEQGRRLSHAELVDIARECPQVIWASFLGYEQHAKAPWIKLNAVDSSYWEVITEDSETRDLIISSFKDVGTGKL